MTKRRKQNAQFMLIVGAVGLGVLLGAGWAVWQLMGHVAPDWARAWAIVATLLLPVAFGAGNSWGQTENRGKLKGIDAGVDRVTRAAAAAIDLRATSARKMKQAQQAPAVILPPLPAIVERPQIVSGEIEEW